MRTTETEMVNVFIGFDQRETVAFNVLAHSINARSSVPVSICPINLRHLENIFDRSRDAKQSTDFSFSRFLTPYLSGYDGWSIFMDCDMLMLADVAELYRLRDDRYSAMCVKHDHQPADTTKFLGEPQTRYEKKNWSSVLLFNNAKCSTLTPEYVNTASGLELHQFKWLDSDDLIGPLPAEWNHLVGWSEPNPGAKLVHYTEGGPYFEPYRDCEFSEEWFAEEADAFFGQDTSLANKRTRAANPATRSLAGT